MKDLLFKLKPTILSIFVILSTAIIFILLCVQYYTGIHSAKIQTTQDAKQISFAVFENLKTQDAKNENFIDFLQYTAGIENLSSLSKGHPFFKTSINYLKKNDNIYALYLGYGNGDFYEVINLQVSPKMHEAFEVSKKARWLIIRIEKKDSKTIRYEEALDANLQTVSNRQINSDYDPTQRPWYKLAQTSSGVNKTKPYLFAHIPESGITYSKKVEEKEIVLGLDITFSSIESRFKEYDLLKGTKIFLIDEKQNLLASNEKIKDFDFKKEYMNQKIAKFDNKKYFINTISLQDSSNLFLFVSVPYNEAMAPHMQKVYQSLFIAALIVSVIVPFILYLTKIIIQPIKMIENENDKIKNREYDKVKYVKTYIYELDKLAKSLVDMAMIIKSHEEYLKRTSLELLQQYKDTIDRSAIVSKTDKDGIITYVNDYFCEVSGYSKDELIGQSHRIVRHPDMPLSLYEDMWHTIKNKKQAWKGEIKNRKKDGSFYWVQSIVNPILDENDEVIEFIAIRNNITRQKAMFDYFQEKLSITTQNFEHALHLSKEYEKAIDRSNVLSRTDTEGKITYVNDEFIKLSGYSKEELIGKTHAIVSSPNLPKKFYEVIWDTISKGNVWQGVIKNLSKKSKPFWTATSIVPINDEENEIIEYMAIRHDLTELFELHREIEATQKEIVYKMGEVGELRSKETGNHVRRVAEYSKHLAIYYGLSYKDAEILFTASPMHDIGKVGIRDSILKKPSKLDSNEWAVMQTHAKIGYEILKTSDRKILKAAATVAHEHHERWDGSGYPRGLSQENIHIYGRITAVADVFDALGSERCYKKAWRDEDIFAFLKDQSGKHFEPKLIELFFANLDTFLEIRDRLKDNF